MPFEINHGLGRFNSKRDLHAALGIPLSAAPGEIRKRYLKIAKTLHPDSRDDESGKKMASDLLSKFVNPAYEVLSQEKEREEYQVILRLLEKQLLTANIVPTPTFDLAQEVFNAANVEEAYQKALNTLAQDQYKDLNNALKISEQISELNLIYLWRSAGGKATTATVSTPAPPPKSDETQVRATPAAATGTTPPTEAPKTEQFTEQYFRRAEELFNKGIYLEAIKELKDALKIDPRSARCNALLGKVYLQQGSLSMAKIHFNQALKLNPQEVTAIQGLEAISKRERKAQQQQKNTEPPKPEKKKSSFFGLFGKK
ncbi:MULTISPECIES: DnaJ domain-containing protein [unclassified Thermosynechococcus]|uniref:J domain-containing protein n=1 Tax=unclassified Thermosynechococcus TaxID=2622553 RepID=UPI002671B408|nr:MULTISPECIES: DnaJ domain-containing protein [unclassified Thermosynechococcus]MDR5638586.1 DnaJ domain-containing protein [Thermosynechococcus sp. PP42]MDR7921406.1 DnaJ domain-containing protein [Thermosynechococcus sp. HY213]WKT81844.1 DnaJ domain-containing protein [Thermosynechococcus sp. PP45]WNC25456.1 DnaJ domain-containing protein [Thermosynechococcus sp. PP551]WNC28035.1 DnaJ domain-containing protein [Thermosynechococcus sp. PP555]